MILKCTSISKHILETSITKELYKDSFFAEQDFNLMSRVGNFTSQLSNSDFIEHLCLSRSIWQYFFPTSLRSFLPSPLPTCRHTTMWAWESRRHIADTLQDSKAAPVLSAIRARGRKWFKTFFVLSYAH